MIDLSAYFSRIDYSGLRKPTLEVLQQLHLRHTLSIPFENLSPLTGMEVRLDIPSLLDKFTRQKRGGYCYEHNLLFQKALESIGFRTKSLAARVRLNVPDGIMTARSHMMLIVEVEGTPYIADTGFGGLTLTCPIELRTGTAQQTPHGLYRLMQQDEAYRLEIKIGEEWKVLYVFDLAEQVLQDYEVNSWYLSHHPQSLFVQNLIVSLPVKEGRHTLTNTHYSFYHLDGSVQREEITTMNGLREVLENKFHIDTSTVQGLDDKLSRLIQANPS